MDIEAWWVEVPCARCGARIWPERERGYRFGEQQALCWECALALGGRYDGERERWVQTPNITGLAGGAG